MPFPLAWITQYAHACEETVAIDFKNTRLCNLSGYKWAKCIFWFSPVVGSQMLQVKHPQQILPQRGLTLAFLPRLLPTKVNRARDPLACKACALPPSPSKDGSPPPPLSPRGAAYPSQRSTASLGAQAKAPSLPFWQLQGRVSFELHPCLLPTCGPAEPMATLPLTFKGRGDCFSVFSL